MSAVDDLTYGHPMHIDHEADMAYIEVRELRPGEYVHRTNVLHEDDGVLIDYDADGHLVGIELFLAGGRVRPESDAVVRRLLAGVQE